MNSLILGYPSWLVIGFGILILVMLAIDLGIFNKESHEVSNKEALGFSMLWISLAMAFSGLIWYLHGFEDFSAFQAAYWVEKALSVDNLFVFILVFGFFKIPKIYQHKVLFYGVLWAIVFRAIFIFAGVGLINMTYIPKEVFSLPFQHEAMNPIMLLFGIFLIFSGIKSWNEHSSDHKEEVAVTEGKMYKFINKFFTISPTLEGDKFFIVKNGIKMITPLMVALIIIELTDLVFAIDSIPAIFAISKDPFILYTSNIFAILGLRSLYFLLANSLNLFSKLHFGLAIILSFIGIKMIIMPWYHFPIGISLAFIALVLIGTVIWSIVSNKKAQNKIIHPHK